MAVSPRPRAPWVLLAACALLPACNSVRHLHITSDPPGAFIKANQTNVGVSPLTYEYDTRSMPAFTVTAELEGYFPESIVIRKDSRASTTGQIQLAMRQNPVWQETTTSRATNTWLRLQITPELTQETSWQKIVDAVTTSYDSLEQLDPLSGYLRSTAQSRRWDLRDTRGIFEVRTQFLGSVSSKEPLIYKMKIKADFRWGGSGDWQPYERVFSKDADLIEELTNRLGLK